MRVHTLGVVAVAGLWLQQPALAAGQDSAASEALFDKAVADLEAGKYDSACPAFAESHRLDPRAGTVFALAECEAGWGRLASAVAHYSDYLGMVSRMTGAELARHKDRSKTAEQQVAALRPRVPQLSLVLPPSAPKGTIVKRDDVSLSEVSLGMPLPVDPGSHTITTQVPGGPEHKQTVEIAAGERKRVELALELAGPAGPPTKAADTSESPRQSQPGAGSGRDRTWAYVAGGIGVAGLAAGAVTGLMTMSKKKIADDNCVGASCNQQGLDATEDGKTLGNISTVGFGVGIAGLAAGVVLWVTSPKNEAPASATRGVRPTAFAGSGFGSIGLQGTW